MSAGLATLAERAWAGDTPGARALRASLVPAALAYAAVTAVRNRLYDGGWLAVARLPVTVLSVGNIAVGGTGKTPTALWLAGQLRARGRRVGIVARGYRKARRGVVVVGEDGTPLVTPTEGGDEAVLLARRFAGPVVTGERRAEAARVACARFGLDTIVLDDGFQHRALARDADLVLVTDATAAAWPLPAGPLREPRGALLRARALLLVDGQRPPAAAVPVFRGHLRPTALVRAGPPEWVEEPLAALAGQPVLAVAGVARPERFVRTLVASGAVVERLMRFPDHHAYGPDDVTRIAAAAGGRLVLTTEKDLVKLAGQRGLPAVAALRVTLEVEEGGALVDLLLATAGTVALRPD